jgi:hypothetical protein
MALHKATKVLKNVTAVTGAQYWGYTVKPDRSVETGGTGTPGRKGAMVSRLDAIVRIYGTNLAYLLGLIGSTKENVVCGYATPAGNRKKTFKNVRFTTPLGTFSVKAKDAGGKIAVYGIEGHCCWGDADTLATMIVDATDP